jgi:ribokinase
VGSNTLDVFVETDAQLVKVLIHDEEDNIKKEPCLVYPLGAKMLITDLHFEIGGGGTNTAVSFSRLGLKTGYIGKIGHDNSGIQVFNLLHKENVEFLGSFGEKTGYSVILDAKVDDRTILTFKGCNDEFSYSEIDKKKLKTKWFYFSSMTNSSFQVLNDIAKFAAKNNMRISFNPSRYLVVKGASYLKNVFKNTNVLIVNKEEGEILSKKLLIDEVLIYLKKYIKDYVIITDGRNGCWCYDGKTVIHAKPRKNLKIVETTGAGDAFASAFTSGLIYGKNMKTCLKMGMIQAESVIQHRGAKNILLSKERMFSLLKKDKRVTVERILKG